MKNWKVGDLVAVNKLDEGQVFEIYEEHKSNKFMFYLVYTSAGHRYGGGWMDSCVYLEPTKAQLKNYIKTMANRHEDEESLYEFSKR